MRLLDSSVIIAFLNEDDSLHGKAVGIDLMETGLNELVLAEVANVLQKRVKNKARVKQMLETLLKNTPLVLAGLSFTITVTHFHSLNAKYFS